MRLYEYIFFSFQLFWYNLFGTFLRYRLYCCCDSYFSLTSQSTLCFQFKTMVTVRYYSVIGLLILALFKQKIWNKRVIFQGKRYIASLQICHRLWKTRKQFCENIIPMFCNSFLRTVLVECVETVKYLNVWINTRLIKYSSLSFTLNIKIVHEQPLPGG